MHFNNQYFDIKRSVLTYLHKYALQKCRTFCRKAAEERIPVVWEVSLDLLHELCDQTFGFYKQKPQQTLLISMLHFKQKLIAIN